MECTRRSHAKKFPLTYYAVYVEYALARDQSTVGICHHAHVTVS